MSDIQHCFDLVQSFEKTYSRFISGNYLDTLNTNKNSDITAEFFSILQLCIKVSEMTQWYFDISLRPLLENAGYGIVDWKLDENIGYKNIILSREHVTLNNGISLDIWSVGKWYMIDVIYKYLETRYERFLIDFGGDIRVKWSYTIGLEDPNLESPHSILSSSGTEVSPNWILWRIRLQNCSIASSSWNRRTFGTSHHLINPKTKCSVDDKQAIFLTHKLATFSDIFSTALFVSPIDIAIRVLNTVPGLEGMIIMSDGTIHKTRNFIWQK